jgi:hypothetical protein
MPVRSEWLPDSRILVQTFEGDVTEAEALQMAEAMLAALETGPVGLLDDMLHMHSISANMMKMPIALKITRHRNLRGVAVLGTNGFARFALQMFLQGGRVKLCNTWEEGRAFLESKLEAEPA